MSNPKTGEGERPELSATEVQERVWSEPGGEALALREAMTGAEGDVDGQTDAVERETPGDTIQRISDPTIRKPILGADAQVASENAGKNQGLGTEGGFFENGDGGQS